MSIVFICEDQRSLICEICEKRQRAQVAGLYYLRRSAVLDLRDLREKTEGTGCRVVFICEDQWSLICEISGKRQRAQVAGLYYLRRSAVLDLRDLREKTEGTGCRVVFICEDQWSLICDFCGNLSITKFSLCCFEFPVKVDE